MIDRKISIRYAKALDKICEDSSIKERNVLEYLSSFLNIIKGSHELSEFLNMSIIPMEKRIEVADELLSNNKNFYIKKFVRKDIADKIIGEDSNFYVKEFVKYIIKKNRLMLLDEIVEIFEELVDEKENMLKATVTSVIELDNETKTELKSNLEKKFNKTIDFIFLTDESLMAGIVVKIDDIVYDGSVNTYLNNLERRLLRLPL